MPAIISTGRQSPVDGLSPVSALMRSTCRRGRPPRPAIRCICGFPWWFPPLTSLDSFLLLEISVLVGFPRQPSVLPNILWSSFNGRYHGIDCFKHHLVRRLFLRRFRTPPKRKRILVRVAKSVDNISCADVAASISWLFPHILENLPFHKSPYITRHPHVRRGTFFFITFFCTKNQYYIPKLLKCVQAFQS